MLLFSYYFQDSLFIWILTVLLLFVWGWSYLDWIWWEPFDFHVLGYHFLPLSFSSFEFLWLKHSFFGGSLKNPICFLYSFHSLSLFSLLSVYFQITHLWVHRFLLLPDYFCYWCSSLLFKISLILNFISRIPGVFNYYLNFCIKFHLRIDFLIHWDFSLYFLEVYLASLKSYFELFVRKCIHLHFFRISHWHLILSIWWCNISLIILDLFGSSLMSMDLKM